MTPTPTVQTKILREPALSFRSRQGRTAHLHRLRSLPLTPWRRGRRWPWTNHPERAGWQMTQSPPLPTTSLAPTIYPGREGYGFVEAGGRGVRNQLVLQIVGQAVEINFHQGFGIPVGATGQGAEVYGVIHNSATPLPDIQ